MMKNSYTILYVSAATAMLVSGCGSDSGSGIDESEPTPPPVATDTTAPVISLVGNAQIDVVFNAKFSDLGATANDETDGELTVASTGEIDTHIAGEYQINYSATDSSGNSSSVTRTVKVLEDRNLTTTTSVPDGPLSAFFDGVLVEADYWSHEPEILSAGMGFADIVAIDAPALTIDLVRQAGGAWNQDADCGTDTRNYTATSTQQQVTLGYITQTPFGDLKDGALGLDGLPIVFSWPIDTSTVNLTDFQFTLNTGDIVRPLAVSAFPNIENNERNTIVVFAEWGNRLPSSDPDSRFPIKLEIVEDDTPLLMVGPNAEAVSAVGLTWETTTTPYDVNNGPKLVGAKLNRIDGPMAGEGINTPIPIMQPNDASVLFEEGDFMLRMLTSGGFSPDGQTGVRPDEYERYFRIHATGTDGSTVHIEQVGVEYQVQGGSLRVVGLSDLGQAEGGEVFYDVCYDEDVDNYIDIILVGDEAAARNITFLEIPSLEGGYSPFYSPGGPSRTPFDGVNYTQPGPMDLEPVIIALDDPMRVTYPAGTDIEPPSDSLSSIDVNGDTREYMVTVPTGYTGNESVPLIFDFHGLNSSAQVQFDDSQLSVIAERENVIVVNPQAVDGIWTVTGFPVSNGADDFGFINALIDELSTTYNIDTSRIYATGMSQGGFLTIDLACQFSDRFAAIAPVSGVMSQPLLQSCEPTRPVPVLQTHGTDDSQIPYENVDPVIQFWTMFNQTDTDPVITELPDLFLDNGKRVQRFTYMNESNGIAVEHLRIDGGDHFWPGTDGDSDINMAEEVWRFVSRYDLNGLR